MDIAICHRRSFGQVWVPSSPTRSCRKTPLPVRGTPLDLRLPRRKIVIILRCNPWAVEWSLEGMFYGKKWENRPKSENWATLTPRSSATVRRRDKKKSCSDLGNSLALGLQRGVNNIFLQCISKPNLVKIGRCEVAERSRGLPQKKLALRGTRPSPRFAHNGPIVPKIP